MKIKFKYHKKSFVADLDKPLQISIPIRSGAKNPNCFWAPRPEFSPVRTDSFVGSTAEGGIINFFNVKVNPHGNGTHTECVGHIAKERFVLRKCMKKSHFFAKLISVEPIEQENGDWVIEKKQIKEMLEAGEAEALIIRTIPNFEDKKTFDYSGKNPTYIHHKAVEYLVDCGINHLLIDQPSVDREEDGAAFLAHKAFWKYPEATRTEATITELIYVKNSIPDGFYLLDIQTLRIDLDVSPSRVVLFEL